MGFLSRTLDRLLPERDGARRLTTLEANVEEQERLREEDDRHRHGWHH